MEVSLDVVSMATLRNWKKLSTVASEQKLKKRANKLLSTRIIIPKEYFSNYNNLKFVENLLTFISDQKISISTAVKSICVNLLISKKMLLLQNEKFISDRKNVMNLIKSWRLCLNSDLLNFVLPKDEKDIVGLIYQCLLLEGDKNKKGSYYTPQNLINKLFQDMPLGKDKKYLDPCCGTGSFLLNFNTLPQKIYGFDIDENAVDIAKTNLIIKFSNIEFKPNIYCIDFLKLNNNLLLDKRFANIKFDYIITNPPWGTKNSSIYANQFAQIVSKENFSYFIVKSFDFLQDQGKLRLILPESILNVKVHSDIRKFILSKLSIESIYVFGQSFTGVVSNIIGLNLTTKVPEKVVKIESKTEKYYVDMNNFRFDKDNIFNLTNKDEFALLKKIYKIPYLTLLNSIWGLGIVTGDNRNKLKKTKTNDLYPILTGKEIEKYSYKEPKWFFEYNKAKLQQVANERIYKSKEKLIYKFISNKLVFAYDDTQKFVLNSANVLIPNIEGMNIKTVMAFLNSDVMQFVYKKSFNQIKVMKGNLCKLPFPIISKENDFFIKDMVDKILDRQGNAEELDKYIYNIYGLTSDEIKVIKGENNGTIN